MKVSIVIPAHNAAATLGECLAAATNQTYADREVIVIDDGSADNSVEIARKFPVTLIQQPKRGPAAARNAGARVASGDIVAFTDSDCIPHKDWIAQLVENFGDGVGAVGGTYGIANTGSVLARIIHNEIRSRHAGFGYEVDFLGSYNLAVKRDVFNALNGFDEDFKAASGEDNDLSYRIHDAGYALHYTPAAVVDHYHPERLAPYLRSQMRHGFWRMKLYAKHPRRSGGDKYAGTVELACTSFAFLILLAMLLLPWPFLAGIPFGLAICIVFWRSASAGRMVASNKDIRMLLAAPVLLLRDIARGVGLARGVWHFVILRRTTA
ncbi:MAG: glycosyltransferase [Candidatus Hydrogenedentes bacterium]|nr:glycosyltransferase [Candidatus Hydrogenedentota bacterium]